MSLLIVKTAQQTDKCWSEVFCIDLEFSLGLDVDLAVGYKSSIRTLVNYVVRMSNGGRG